MVRDCRWCRRAATNSHNPSEYAAEHITLVGEVVYNLNRPRPPSVPKIDAIDAGQELDVTVRSVLILTFLMPFAIACGGGEASEGDVSESESPTAEPTPSGIVVSRVELQAPVWAGARVTIVSDHPRTLAFTPDLRPKDGWNQE